MILKTNNSHLFLNSILKKLMRSILLENYALLQMCFLFFFNSQDVSLKCWSNPTLHDETSGAPQEPVFMGCWGVEGRGWGSASGSHYTRVSLTLPPMTSGVLHFFLGHVKSGGEVFVAVAVVVSQCGLVDSFSVAWLENGQVLFIWWDGNAGAGGEPKWCLDVCLVSQCHSAQLSGCFGRVRALLSFRVVFRSFAGSRKSFLPSG